MDCKNMGFATRQIHAGKHDNGVGALCTPIYQTSTFEFDTVQQGGARFAGQEEGYIYSRLGNPSLTQVEEKLAALEGGVAALALVSQPLYAVALGHTNNAMYAVPFAQHPLRALYTFYIKSWETPSILLPLLLGLLLLLCIRERKYIPALLIYVLCERFSGSLDYGVGGIRLMILFYLFLEYPALCFAVTTAYMLAWALDGRGYPIFGVQFGMRLFAVPAVMLASLPIRRKTQLPKWLTYGFYPAHLIILLILEKIF